eukprot:s1629_g3.t1
MLPSAYAFCRLIQELAMSLLEQRGQVTPQPSVASVVLPTASLGSVDQASVEEAVASAAKAARGYTGKVSCSYDEVERCIGELQDLVKACRGPQSPQTEQAAQGHDSLEAGETSGFNGCSFQMNDAVAEQQHRLECRVEDRATTVDTEGSPE